MQKNCPKQGVTLALLTFLLCANFGAQDESVAGREKPRINFYGTLTDTTGESYNVENISISGMCKQIPVYQKPASKDVDPTINITRIDFSELHSISVPNPNAILNYNNRQYIEILITSKDHSKTSKTYIIERSKRLICDQINTAGPIEKDLSFQAVDTVVFEGYRTPEPIKNGVAPTQTNKENNVQTPTTASKERGF